MKTRSLIVLFALCVAAIIGIAVYTEYRTAPSAPIPLRFETEATAVTAAPEQSESNKQVPTASAKNTSNSATFGTSDTTVTRPVIRDLNLASAEDLQRVNGIGEKLSAAILSERDRRGKFTRRADLLEIDGIGEVLLSRIFEEFYITDELPPVTQPVQTTPSPQMTEKPHVSSISPALTTQPIEAGIYDINLVTREELLLIDGVNTEIADGILAMRELLGGYQNVRELVFVEQIRGNELMQTLFAHLYVADAAETTASTVG